jgi:hypothetical protein
VTHLDPHRYLDFIARVRACSLNKSCMGRLLKVCNQKAIFPPYGALKLSKLYREFPFKDCAGVGSWLIQIGLQQDANSGSIEQVCVTHDRKQQSTEMVCTLMKVVLRACCAVLCLILLS